MLQSLYISNYALIDEARIDFGKGLNILTGETGAGKSLLLGAIGLILGKRLDFSHIFNPDRKCVVEAVFKNLPPGAVVELISMEEFDWEDAALVIRREAYATGKSRAFINDTPVSAQVIKVVTSMLVDLHGQHQNQQLLSPDFQLRLLDQYAGCSQDASAFGRVLSDYRRIGEEISEKEKEETEARKQQDFLQFQLSELQQAALLEGEEEELASQIELLRHAEEVKESLDFAATGLYEDENSVYNRLSEIISRLDPSAKIDAGILAQHKSLHELRYALEDAARELSHINDSIDLDPARLDKLQMRYDQITRLKLKYSVREVTELIAIREEYAAKSGHFESLSGQIAALRDEQGSIEKDLAAKGISLEKNRKSAAKGLKTAVDTLLQQVGLQNGAFEVVISRNIAATDGLALDNQKIEPGPTGFNNVDFHIRTNAGLPMGSLSQIASGGEVSRVMLAVKAALAEKAELSVLIFDEIDTGISGETAIKVSKVMAQLSKRYQVLAITHLAQIAAKGDQHFRIHKEVVGKTTVSRVSPLAEDDRILELAYMLSGKDPSPAAIDNAKELMSGGRG